MNHNTPFAFKEPMNNPLLTAEALRAPRSHSRAGIRALFLSLGLLGGAAKTSEALAQVPPQNQAEYIRLFSEGNQAYARGDFMTARRLLLQAERLNPTPDPAMSWNISMADIHLAGFDVVNSSTSNSDATRINGANRTRLDTVLGFTTVQQIGPVREMLTDAIARMRAYRESSQRYLQSLDALPPAANSSERAERRRQRETATMQINDGNIALPFFENAMQSIESRHREIVAANNPGRGNPDNRGNGQQIIVVGGQEYTERRETNWFTTARAIPLATGVAGLAAAGVGLAGYMLNLGAGRDDESRCRALQSQMNPCPVSLQLSFEGNSERASAFGVTGWVGGGIAALSTVLFLALPAETRVIRERRSVPTRTTQNGGGVTVVPSFSRNVLGGEMTISF